MIDNDELRYSFDKVRDTDELPVDAVPVTIIAKENEWHLDGYYETEYKPPAEEIYFDFRSFLRHQQDFITQYYDHIEFLPSQPARDEKGDIIEQNYRDSNGNEIDMSNNTMRLYEAIQSQQFRDRKLLIATDGGAVKFKGVNNGKGAANFKGTLNSIGSIGFLVTDDEGNPYVRCYGQPAGLNPQSF